jgi:hypothetical protein
MMTMLLMRMWTRSLRSNDSLCTTDSKCMHENSLEVRALAAALVRAAEPHLLEIRSLLRTCSQTSFTFGLAKRFTSYYNE